MKEVIEYLKERIASIKEYNEPMNSASWGYEEGCVISGEDAQKIIYFYEHHKQESDPQPNAAFISAAPEMLELLKELCQLVKESARIYDNPFEGDDKIFESIKKSQLVINKAESK